MVLRGLSDGKEPKDELVRQLRSREIPLQVQTEEEAASQRQRSTGSQDSQNLGRSPDRTGLQLTGQRQTTSAQLPGEEEEEERRSQRSYATRRSHRSQLVVELEEMEADYRMQQMKRNLEKEEQEMQRKNEEIQRKKEEVLQLHEIEKKRREVRRASQAGSQVNVPLTTRSISRYSSHVRTTAWVENQSLVSREDQVRQPSVSHVEVRPSSPKVVRDPYPSSLVPDRVDFTKEHNKVYENNTQLAAPFTLEDYLSRKSAAKSLPSFSGDPTDWLNFITTYHRSTIAGKFSSEENLIRLDKALTGKARESVKSLLAVPNAAHDIIKILELQFGRPLAIINSLVDKVKKFPRLTDEHTQGLVDFSVKLHNLVVAIECLDQGSYLSNPQLVDDIVGKLSPVLRLQWGEHAAIGLGGVADLKDMNSWLYKKALGAAHISNPSSSAKSNSRPERLNLVSDNLVEKSSTDNPKLICSHCREKHKITDCPALKDLPVPDRRKWVRENNLCFLCLGRNHRVIKCRSKKRCGVGECRSRHHSLLHLEDNTPQADKENEAVNVVAHSLSVTSTVLLKVLPVRLRGPKGDCVVAALLDEGANCSIVDWDIAQALGLEGRREPLCVQWIQDVRSNDEESMSVSLSVSGVDPRSNRYQMNRVRTLRNLSLPYQTVSNQELGKIWPKSTLITLGDIPGPPKLLIGQDNWSLIESFKTIRQSWNGLGLTKTRLGWVLHGRVGASRLVADKNFPLHICEVEKPEDFLHRLIKESFSFDFMSCPDNSLSLSVDEKKAVAIMDKTTLLVDSHWEVGLLWKYDTICRVDSRPNALNRLFCIERKMDRDASFAKQYTEKIDDYISKGYARRLTTKELKDKYDRIWYLPHLAVFSPNKPNKIRVVFDASAKTQGVSLNSQLLKGPDLYNSIPSILMRFRRGSVGFGGDIREMFLRIKIRRQDQSCQRFLWRGRDKTRDPEEFVMESMLFGAVCSPFQAQDVKNRNALRYQNSHPRAVEAIINSHYMDDYLDSVDTDEDAISLIRDVIMIHRSGGFDMINWVSNSQLVLKNVESNLKDNVLFDAYHSEKVLGLRWNPVKDVFIFRVNRDRISGNILSGQRLPTKREFLKIIMSIFDPLGFLGWFMINVKILLQDIWRVKTEWDEYIDAKFKFKWEVWLKNLEEVEKLEIPRCYCPLIPMATSLELHVFCDASDRAYAAVCYIRIVYAGEVFLCLVSAKSRVAPLKQVSVPRLELQAAVLGSRLGKSVKKGIGLNFNSEFYWSDSKTVLHWIHHNEVRYRMFVAHRLGEIVESTEPKQWRWVSGIDNPADDATKGQTRMLDRWLAGPDFLKYEENSWPQYVIESSDIGNRETLERLNLVIAGNSLAVALPDPHRFSNWLKLVRTIGWILRFIRRSKRKTDLDLSLLELRQAEILCWKRVQEDCFSDEIAELRKGLFLPKNSRLYRLTPFIDDDGLLRVKGRIDRTLGVSEEIKYPVILDPRSRFVTLLIDFYHKNARHQGQAYVANELRQRYWILGLRRAVRSAWSRCATCARERTKPFEQPMAPLPAERLQHHSRPFTNAGVDYFGPFFVTNRRSKEKRYGVIFTCMSTRAIHLELVNDLSTDGTLLAIRRMASRRGYPTKIWSDNGTNFRAADRVIRECLKKFDQKEISDELSTKGVEWVFLPPAAPHMGGSWERLIWSVKKALKVTMTEQAPREEVLLTLLTEVESLVNSRPLTVVSEDPNDTEALTPNHFLIGTSSGSVPWSKPDETLDLRRRWQRTQHLADHFWHRWVREYLPGLVKKTKWFGKKQDIQIGELVYIVERNRPRGEWVPGRIIATYPGKDGLVRVVDLKTKNGVVRRPITGLLPLLGTVSSDSQLSLLGREDVRG